MNFINKLERKYGKYGIPNLTMYIIGCYVLGYVLMMFNPRVMSMLSLNVTKILHGQIWRLVTWVIYPPSTGGLFWFLLAVLFFYYPIGTSLERTWGTFRYTLYMLSGVVFTVIAAFILHFMTGGYADVFAGSIFTTYYISMSVFLAYAVIYSEAQILLYFVIPIKMKWMAIFYVVIIGYDVINYLRAGMWFMVVPIVASLLNFILFFFGTRDMSRYNPKEVRRKQEFKRQWQEAE